MVRNLQHYRDGLRREPTLEISRGVPTCPEFRRIVIRRDSTEVAETEGFEPSRPF